MTVLCDNCSPRKQCTADKNRTECKYYQPQTNEEWFIGLSTEEKAEVFIEICRDAFRAEEYRRNHWSDLQTIEYWEGWLKQPHKGD